MKTSENYRQDVEFVAGVIARRLELALPRLGLANAFQVEDAIRALRALGHLADDPAIKGVASARDLTVAFTFQRSGATVGMLVGWCNEQCIDKTNLWSYEPKIQLAYGEVLHEDFRPLRTPQAKILSRLLTDVVDIATEIKAAQDEAGFVHFAKRKLIHAPKATKATKATKTVH